MKVSIIIPIYNVERYLPRCLDSVCRQTYQDIEILLIDDGSDDQSGAICDQYAANDKRIKVIHKSNGGLSDARNSGLEIATGEYITFVDGDDFVTPYYVEHLCDAMSKGGDMAVSWFASVFPEEMLPQGKKELIRFTLCNKVTCLEKLLYQDGVETNACGKLYKRSLFGDLRYPVGKLYEDIVVTYKAIERCENIAVIGNEDYYYWQRNDSIQYVRFTRHKMDAINQMEELGKLVDSQHPELMKAFYCRFFSLASNILFQINDTMLYRAEYDRIWNILKSIRIFIVKNRRARKKARIAAFLSYLGPGVFSKVYRLTQKRAQLYLKQ